ISSASLTGAKAVNYDLSLTGAPTTTATISQKTLTIGGSFTALDKVYSATTAASINANSLTLVTKIGSDDVSLTSVVVVFATADAANGKTVSISSASLTGTKAANYSLSLTGAPTATASISQKALTMSGLTSSNRYEY
ncbi:MAG: hypothetical protein EBT21_08260, partial [Actinobacteria bacterium]|nr:hypothetical protein [Actinomycetota bacterium]